MKITEKYVLNLILSIVLVFSLLGGGAAVFAKQYLLDADTFIAVSDEKEIPQKAYDEINDYFTKNEAYSRIPADVYMSALTVDDVKLLIDDKITDLFDEICSTATDRAEIYDFTLLEQNITDYFDEFAKENNVEVNDEYTAQLKKTIDTAKSEILNFTDIYMIDFIKKTNAVSKAESLYKYITPVIYACAGIALVCIILIAVFSGKRIGNIFYWISTSVICMAVLSLIPTLVLKISGITDRFVVRTKCVYKAYTGLFSDAISTLMLAEIIIFAVGVALLVIGIIASKHSNTKN